MNNISIQFHYLGPIISQSPKDFLESKDAFVDQQRSQLAYFLGINSQDLTKELVEQYIEVTPTDAHQLITPAYDKINVRILEPLKIAKKSYCFGEYVTATALSGIVGETMSHVFLQLYETKINGVILDNSSEEAIFGRKFDELGQNRRIKILSKLRYISSDQEKFLHNLRNVRRPYMHWWNLGKSVEEIKSDAKQAIIESTKLFSSVFSIQLASASSISIDPKVKIFLGKVEKSTGHFYNSKY